MHCKNFRWMSSQVATYGMTTLLPTELMACKEHLSCCRVLPNCCSMMLSRPCSSLTGFMVSAAAHACTWCMQDVSSIYHQCQCAISVGCNLHTDTHVVQFNIAGCIHIWVLHSHLGAASSPEVVDLACTSCCNCPDHLPCTMLTAIFYAGESNSLQFTLNRPFDKGSQTKASGQWQWVGLPQANLINGKGFYGDCNLIGGLPVGAGVATREPVCNVSTSIVPAGEHTVLARLFPSLCMHHTCLSSKPCGTGKPMHLHLLKYLVWLAQRPPLQCMCPWTARDLQSPHCIVLPSGEGDTSTSKR